MGVLDPNLAVQLCQSIDAQYLGWKNRAHPLPTTSTNCTRNLPNLQIQVILWPQLLFAACHYGIFDTEASVLWLRAPMKWPLLLTLNNLAAD